MSFTRRLHAIHKRRDRPTTVSMRCPDAVIQLAIAQQIIRGTTAFPASSAVEARHEPRPGPQQ
jgi:hypothetical protein